MTRSLAILAIALTGSVCVWISVIAFKERPPHPVRSAVLRVMNGFVEHVFIFETKIYTVMLVAGRVGDGGILLDGNRVGKYGSDRSVWNQELLDSLPKRKGIFPGLAL